MFTNIPPTQRLKLISEPSCSKENVYSEMDSMNETPSKLPTQPLSNRRRSNFGMEKYQPFDKKESRMGTPIYGDISENNTPLHHRSGVSNMQETLVHYQQKILVGEDMLENRRFSMRNSVSVSFTHPELVAIDPQEMKNLGITEPSLANNDANDAAENQSMFKEIGESFILHSKPDTDEVPVLSSSETKPKVRRSRNERSKQTTADTEPCGQRVETKQSSGEPSIYSPSVNEIDPVQLSTSRQTTEKSEENIFNKTLVSNESNEKDLPMQIVAAENHSSLQGLLNNLHLSKDSIEKHQVSELRNPQFSQFQTESSIELHNVYEDSAEEKAFQQYRTKSSEARSQARSCVHIVPSAMNPSELESLYEKLESPTHEDKIVAERQIRGSRSSGNIFQNQGKMNMSLEKNMKNKGSREVNLPLQQSHSGKKSNNSLSMDRGHNSHRNKTRDFFQKQQDLNASHTYTESDMINTEVDDYDNIEEQKLCLNIKMATRDNIATPPQYSARILSARVRDIVDYSRVKTQQYEGLNKNTSAMTRLERDYLADLDRKKRLAELVAQSNKTQPRKSAVQNKKVAKKVVPEKVEERIVMKSKMPTRRESHVDIVENKRDISAERSAIIIDKPLQMKAKKEEINLGSINTLRLKRQNPENVLFNKSQNKASKKRFGSNTDRINFNDTVLLNKSQELGRSFVDTKRSDKNKSFVGKTSKVLDESKTQDNIPNNVSIRESKGWTNTLEAVMSGISVGGVSKTWESLTRKINTTVSNNEVSTLTQQNVQEKQLINEETMKVQVAESTAILANIEIKQQKNMSDIEEMMASQFNIKDINLDRLALVLLRQTEEKSARTIQRFVIKKCNFKSRNSNHVEPKAIENLENLFKHYEELYSKISSSLGVEGTKFTQKELIMTFITISCFLNSKHKLNNANRIQNQNL